MSVEHERAHEHRGAVPVRRVEAFADGVFAIAATLLILDVVAAKSPLSAELLRICPATRRTPSRSSSSASRGSITAH